MGNINVSYLQENNWARDFNFSGSHLAAGVDWHLGDTSITAGLSLGYARHTGATRGLVPKLWDVSAGLNLRWNFRLEEITIGVGGHYELGAGRIKYDEALEEVQPCQFLSSCQFDRMLGTFSVDRLALGVDVEWGNVLLGAGVSTHSFSANDGVLVPERSIGWYIGGGLRL